MFCAVLNITVNVHNYFETRVRNFKCFISYKYNTGCQDQFLEGRIPYLEVSKYLISYLFLIQFTLESRVNIL